MDYGQLPPLEDKKEEKKIWDKTLWNYVIFDEKYFVCKICYYRMEKTGMSAIKPHLSKCHGIDYGKDIGRNDSLPTNKIKFGSAMIDYVVSHFDEDNDQQNWRCKYCGAKMFGRRKDPLIMNEHLRKDHLDIYQQVSSNQSQDNHDTPGWSGASININPNLMFQENLVVMKEETKFESDDEVGESMPADDEGNNGMETLCKPSMVVGSETGSRYIDEESFQDEETMDLGLRFHRVSQPCSPDQSKRIKTEDVCEEMNNDRRATNNVEKPRISVADCYKKDHRRNIQGNRHSSSKDKQNVKSAELKRERCVEDTDEDVICLDFAFSNKSNAESSRSSRADSTNARASSSNASLKRHSSSQRRSVKQAKRQSLDTDLSDGKSMGKSNKSLPDSNSSSSFTFLAESIKEQFLSSVKSDFLSLDDPLQARFIQNVSNLFRELKEENHTN